MDSLVGSPLTINTKCKIDPKTLDDCYTLSSSTIDNFDGNNDAVTICYHSSNISVVDLDKSRIMHLQQLKHILHLIILYATVCWFAITVILGLLMVREYTYPNSHTAAADRYPSKILIYSAVMAALFVVWSIVLLVCVWRFKIYRQWLYSDHTSPDSIVAGKQLMEHC